MTNKAVFDFTGTSVLVTGGGSGIGAGIAAAFARANANVVITGRRLEPLQKMAEQFPQRISCVQMDVGNDADRRRTIQTVIERHGRLDVLINNAISFTGGAFEERTQPEIAAMYHILLESNSLLIQLALPHLKSARGNVINITSVAGRAVPYPSMGLSVYAAAKAGLNQLTRALASELGHTGVRFNAIAPGVTVSEASEKAGITTDDGQRPVVAATPLGRLGVPADIAGVALFLASDAAAWVTGQIIDAAGGWNITP